MSGLPYAEESMMVC